MRRARLLVHMLATALVVASLAMSGVEAAPETDWPQFHFDAAHTGYNPNETTLGASNVSGLNRQWATALGPGGESSPAVVGGTVFVGADDANLRAVDAVTGAVRWTATTGAAIVLSSPAVADGRVFIGSSDQKLYAFDASTGAQLWNTSTDAAVASPPTVADGTVYAASDKLYALDPATGQVRWTADTGGPVLFSAPSVVDGKIYVGGFDTETLQGVLRGFDATTGERLWTATTFGAIQGAPVLWQQHLCRFGVRYPGLRRRDGRPGGGLSSRATLPPPRPSWTASSMSRGRLAGSMRWMLPLVPASGRPASAPRRKPSTSPRPPWPTVLSMLARATPSAPPARCGRSTRPAEASCGRHRSERSWPRRWPSSTDESMSAPTSSTPSGSATRYRRTPVPDDITTVTSDPAGTVVSFDVAATDNADPNPQVTCAPASGSTFPIGETAVTCTATDSNGNTASATFKVIVLRPLDIGVQVDKFGSVNSSTGVATVAERFRAIAQQPSASTANCSRASTAGSWPAASPYRPSCPTDEYLDRAGHRSRRPVPVVLPTPPLGRARVTSSPPATSTPRHARSSCVPSRDAGWRLRCLAWITD